MFESLPAEMPLEDFRHAHMLALRKRLDFWGWEQVSHQLEVTNHQIKGGLATLLHGILHGGCSPAFANDSRKALCYNLWLHEAYTVERQRRTELRFGSGGAASPPAERLPERFAAARRHDCARLLRAMSGQGGIGVGLMRIHRCPFHRDDEMSLWANTREGGWFCLNCGREGDAISLVSEVLQIGEIDALRLLETGALMWGWPAKPFFPEDVEAPPAVEEVVMALQPTAPTTVSTDVLPAPADSPASTTPTISTVTPFTPAPLLALPERVKEAA